MDPLMLPGLPDIQQYALRTRLLQQALRLQGAQLRDGSQPQNWK